jgi:recombination associated protein RdgC
LGARSGSLTFTRFSTQGALPKDLRRRFLEAARLRVFAPLKAEDEALEATGWCVMERPFDLDLDSAKMFHDSYVLLGFRVDRYRIPGALLKSQITDEEQRQLSRTKKAKLSRNEKLEIKERVVMRLRKKVIPTSKAIDMSWHLDSGTVLFFGHSKRTLGDFCAHFEKTFGLSLVEDSPYAVAARAGLSKERQRALKDVEPVSFSAGRKRLGKAPLKPEPEAPTEAAEARSEEGEDALERVESTRFLGPEFLLWLWLRAEIVSQPIALPELGDFDVWLDNQLTLQSDIDPNERVTVRGAAPSGSAEAREAVRSQKFPVRARIALRNDERDFACVLVAQRFAIASGAIPAVLTKDTDDAFVERMTLVERLSLSLDRLYAAFLEERLSDTWKLGWEPAIVSWADDDAIPTDVLARLMKGSRARSKKAKNR